MEFNFSHFDIALSVGVQKMVRSDLSSSGIAFTIDTETGFATWDGKNTAGEEVATGMYFVVATSGTKSAKGKLLVKKK